MNFVTQGLLLEIILGAPLPSLALVLHLLRASLPTRTDRLLFLLTYWLCYLTLFALLLGYTRAITIWGLSAGLGVSYAPLLLRVWHLGPNRQLAQLWLDTKSALLENGLWGLALAGLTFTILWTNVESTTSDYDSLAYHLPFVCEWIQHQGFVVHPGFASDLAGYYPSNYEALCMLFYFPFHQDAFVLLPNSVIFIYLVCSVHGLIRRLGGSIISGLTATAVLCTTPIVSSNLLSLHVDLPLAAFFFTTLYFGLRFEETTPAAVWCLAGTCGMMIGTKTSGFAYAFLALAAVVIWRPGVFLRLRRHLIGTRLFIALALLLALGGSWYIRNVILFHSPLGMAVQQQSILQSTMLGVFRWSSAHDFLNLVKAFAWQCGLPFVFMSGLGLVLILRREIALRSKLFLIIVAVCTFGLYWITPYGADPQLTPWIAQAIRYAFPFLGSIALLVGVALAPSKGLLATLEMAALSLCAYKIVEVPAVWLICVGVAILHTAGLKPEGYLSRFVQGFRTIRFSSALMAGVLMISLCLPEVYLIRRRVRFRPLYLSGVYHALTQFNLSKIAYVSNEKGFIWYGEHLQTRAIPASGSNAEELARFLEKEGIEAIGYAPDPNGAGEPSIYDSLLHDGRFSLVYGTLSENEPAIFIFNKNGTR